MRRLGISHFLFRLFKTINLLQQNIDNSEIIVEHDIFRGIFLFSCLIFGIFFYTNDNFFSCHLIKLESVSGIVDKPTDKSISPVFTYPIAPEYESGLRAIPQDY